MTQKEKSKSSFKPALVAVEGCSLPQGHQSAESFYRALEIDVLARTLWGEARGEGEAGMIAVAHVILNRVKVAQLKGRYWWGNTVIQVCQKPNQFSCWNRSDPNFGKLQKVDENDRAFLKALWIARDVLDKNGTDDPTEGATHYHAANITPYWAKKEKPCAVIGRHMFYKLV